MTATAVHQLTTAARDASPSVVAAILRLLQQVDSPAEGAFVARALNALARLTAALDDATLGEAAGARSDYEVLLDALDAPAALAVLREDDPLAAARLRGLQARIRLLAAEGGTLSSTQVADLLGITRQAVDKRRKAGRLIGLATGRRGYAYPLWQFDPERRGVLPGLEAVLAALRAHDPWMQVAFFLTPDVRLGGETPLAVLRRGDVAAVRRAAEAYGEQGAA
ncbi:MAG: hypothetical protein QJR03_06115 [Sphaerobacter sp.]|nr:hypothetical protein [Sphaerobacter sp.]